MPRLSWLQTSVQPNALTARAGSMSTGQGGSQPKGISALLQALSNWIENHAVSALIAAMTLLIAFSALGVQIWHGQASQSIALYQAYESSEAIYFLDNLSFDFDEHIKGIDLEEVYKYYIPFLHDRAKNNKRNVYFNVSQFARIMQTIEQCYYDEWIIPVYFLTGCHQKVARMLMAVHIVDIFFTIRTYIYCDPEIGHYFFGLDRIEKLIDELVVKTYDFKPGHVFMSHTERNIAISKNKIGESDNYAVIRISQDRCSTYYPLHEPPSIVEGEGGSQ